MRVVACRVLVLIGTIVQQRSKNKVHKYLARLPPCLPKRQTSTSPQKNHPLQSKRLKSNVSETGENKDAGTEKDERDVTPTRSVR